MTSSPTLQRLMGGSVEGLDLLGMLFDRTPVGMAIIDRDLRLVRFNQTWAGFVKQYTLTPPARIATGAHLFDLIPDNEASMMPVFERVWQGHTVRVDALETISSGIVSYWDVVFTPIAEGDQVVGVVEMTVDATERVMAHRLLEQRVEERTREIEQRSRVAASLRDTLSVINSTRSLPEILDHIVGQARDLINASAAVLHHVDYEKSFVDIEASAGLVADLQGVKGFPLYSSPRADRSILDRRPVMVPEFPSDAARIYHENPAPDPETQYWRLITSQYYRAWLAIPLVVRDEVYGSLAFYFASPQVFSDERVGIATTFAEQAALAIENARLYEQAREAAAAAERNRLARELHDAVSQTLFSASLIAEVLPRLWLRDQQEGLRRLEEVRQLTRGALAEMRTLLLELRPSALLQTDIHDLLRHLTEAVAGRARLDVALQIEPIDLPPDVKIALYRITQEALSNVTKHAEAHHVQVRLANTDGSVELQIIDDGHGFELDSVPGDHLGLRIMRERAASIGAALEIASRPGEGTRIRVTCQDQKESVSYERPDTCHDCR